MGGLQYKDKNEQRTDHLSDDRSFLDCIDSPIPDKTAAPMIIAAERRKEGERDSIPIHNDATPDTTAASGPMAAAD
ncbi:MAG: hypothetical protein IKA76_00590, partial [Clostridia bacterium]|nr:hypothetical protein [Clostridia bacterium]